MKHHKLFYTLTQSGSGIPKSRINCSHSSSDPRHWIISTIWQSAQSGIQRLFFILNSSLVILFFLSGCGPEIVTIDTRQDNIDSRELIEAPGLYISSVKDERGNDPAALGHITGQVGYKKSDIFLADSLSALIKNYYNDLLINHTRDNPVDIVISSFSLVENYSNKNQYHLMGSLDFKYTDKRGNRSSYTSTISKNIDRDRNELAAGINNALRESLQGFVDNINSGLVVNAEPVMIISDSIEGTQIRQEQVSPNLEGDTVGDTNHKRGGDGQQENSSSFDSVTVPRPITAPDNNSGLHDIVSGNTDSSRAVNSSTGRSHSSRSDSIAISHIVYDEPVTVPKIESNPKHLGAGIAYYSGDKITGGMQVEFRMSWQRPDWEYGFSVGFFYMDFINPPYKGNLWAINLPWNMKYMLSPNYVSPYIGGTVKIIAGQNNESGTDSPGYYNNYGTAQSTFWGPTFEESFGLAFDRSVFIEAGVYELFLFNTEALSNDVGFRLSLHFTVTN